VNATAPRGRDSIAQGALALGWLADKIGKPHRGEIPTWCNRFVANGITPLQGSGRNLYRYPGLRFAAPWAIESRPIRSRHMSDRFFPTGEKTAIEARW
jgi:hypothetical protein